MREQKENTGPRHAGRWHRIGRGSCEIWSLEIGPLVRAGVSKGVDVPTTWHASINGVDLGRHASLADGMRKIEDHVISDMRMAVADYAKFTPLYSEMKK